MSVSLILALLVAKVSPPPDAGFLGVTPPHGYVDITSELIETGMIWQRGAGPRAERIGVLFNKATEKTPREYVVKELLGTPGEGASDQVFVSGRNVTICGRPGYEARYTDTVDGVRRVDTAFVIVAKGYAVSASYDRPAATPEDPLSIAAIRKLCPLKK